MSAVAPIHVAAPSAEPLLQRLDGVQKAGQGHRARCPDCGGTSRKLSVTESDGSVLIHCFGGCATADVLAAVGMTFKDIMPPRHWPESPEERRRMHRAARETALIAALPELAYSAAVVRIAASQVMQNIAIDPGDYATLVKAEEVIGNSRSFFCESPRLRQGVAHG